jgi:hypothetical protein
MIDISFNYSISAFIIAINFALKLLALIPFKMWTELLRKTDGVCYADTGN